MMINKDWKLIRLANEKYLRIPPEISDYIAVKDILRLCSYGLSNNTIARRLDMSPKYVEETLEHYFEFPGWGEDLEFNPYYIYSRRRRSFEAFSREIESIIAVTLPFEFFLTTFFICRLYDEITEKLTKFYDKQED